MSRWLRSVGFWAALVAVLTTGFSPLLLLYLVTWPWDRDHVVAGRFFRSMARLVVRLTVGWHFGVDGSAAYPVTGPAVVVSNHESHLDAFLISHLGWEMKWLAKRSLFFIPFVGWCMALAGDVAVVRGRRESTQQALFRLKQILQRGTPAFLFPEGTRAVAPELLPFKRGAFQLAWDADVPIVVLAVAGTRTGLQKHGWRTGPCTARVRVGLPIFVRALTNEADGDAQEQSRCAVDRAMQRARQQIGHLRGELLQVIAHLQRTGSPGCVAEMMSEQERQALQAAAPR